MTADGHFLLEPTLYASRKTAVGPEAGISLNAMPGSLGLPANNRIMPGQ